MSSIAELWAREIQEGRKIIDDVPEKLKKEVQALLEQSVKPE